MPSKKGTEQAMTWLRSKMAEKDTLDAINAEVCYNVIVDLQKKRKAIGALYYQARIGRKRQLHDGETMNSINRKYVDEAKGFQRVSIDIPEEWQ